MAAFSAAALSLYWSKVPILFFLRMGFPSTGFSYQRKNHTRSPLPFADRMTHPFWCRAVFKTTSFRVGAETIGTALNVTPIVPILRGCRVPHPPMSACLNFPWARLHATIASAAIPRGGSASAFAARFRRDVPATLPLLPNVALLLDA